LEPAAGEVIVTVCALAAPNIPNTKNKAAENFNKITPL
jgi:hypothetical protein